MAFVLRFAAVAIAVGILAVVAVPVQSPAAPQPLITAINVRGNAHTPADKIFELVHSRVGTPVDPKQLAADRDAIMGLGFFSDAKTDVRSTPGGVAVTFIVIENPVIAKITFTGNEHVTTDILSALMDTTVGAVLNSNTVRDDVQKINSYYDKLGYTGIRHVQNIDIGADGTLLITVKEGVTVTAIKVHGNTVVPTPLILRAMKTKEGSTFSEQQFQEDLQSINQLYKDNGFSAALDGNADPEHPGVINVNVCEAKVGAIEIQGNSKTRDYVIRRLLRLHREDIITDSRLRRDYEAINNTQYFKSVDLSTKPFQDKCGYLVLVWTVVESRTGTASFQVSYGGGGQFGTGLSGGISYSENNIDGSGNGGNIGVERGPHTSNLNFGISVPYIHKFKPDSVTFSIFNNNVTNQPVPVYKEPGNNPFFSLSPLNGSAFPSTGIATPSTGIGPCAPGSTPCSGQFAEYSSRQAGVQIGFGHPIAEFTRLNLGASASRLAQTFSSNGFPQQFLDLRSALISPGQFSNAQAGAAVQPGTFNLRSLNAGLFRDTRDDVRNPRFGGTSAFSEEFSTKGFGSDFNFSKSDLDYTRFLPVRLHSTLALHLNYGFSTGGTTLPYNDLFTLSDQQVRGTRFVFFGDRELLGQVELRLPLTSDKKFGIALFADSGDAPYITPIAGPTPEPTPTPPSGPHAPASPSLVQPVSYVEAPFHFKSDVGIGIRVQTPILPQIIRIDFATGQGGTHVSFGLGQSF